MVTHARLIEVLRYDPATGRFWWKMRLSPKVRLNRPAGRINTHGYVEIRIDRRTYRANRLAWFYVHQRWPEGDYPEKCRGKLTGRYRACIRVDGKLVALGTHDTPEAASVAYQRAALERDPAFARLS